MEKQTNDQTSMEQSLNIESRKNSFKTEEVDRSTWLTAWMNNPDFDEGSRLKYDDSENDILRETKAAGNQACLYRSPHSHVRKRLERWTGVDCAIWNTGLEECLTKLRTEHYRKRIDQRIAIRQETWEEQLNEVKTGRGKYLRSGSCRTSNSSNGELQDR